MKLLSLIAFQLIFITGFVAQLAAADDYKTQRIQYLKSELNLSQEQVNELTHRFKELTPAQDEDGWQKTRMAYEQILLEVLNISQQEQLGETYAFGRECTPTNDKFLARASNPKAYSPSAPNTLSLAPNPTSDYATISYEIKTAGNITLELRDDQGRKVEVISSGYLDVGNYSKRLDMTDFVSSTYFVTMRSDSEVITEKLILQN